jgi:glycosyltransferase involved in cell wall biosynthesis
VEKALAVIGAKPSNWFVYAFDSISPNEFLRDIDIFIHYTHEAYIEEFGRAVIEAMAAGRPVILPPVFRETFGDAALYVEPHEVWETARRLWQDETEYMARARAGREFVWRNCAFDQLDTRLEKLK